MATPSAQYLPLLVFVPIAVWRIYARVRKSIGRQTLSKWRPWVTITLLPLVIVLLAVLTFAHPEKLALLVCAAVVGVVMGVYGTHHTKFENTPEGLFYTPHAHFGIALSALLIARVVWRMIQMSTLEAPPAPADFAHSWMTLVVFGLLGGYYVTYAIGLVRWKNEVERIAQAR